jgi:hypothetical protein
LFLFLFAEKAVLINLGIGFLETQHPVHLLCSRIFKKPTPALQTFNFTNRKIMTPQTLEQLKKANDSLLASGTALLEATTAANTAAANARQAETNYADAKAEHTKTLATL